MARDDDGEAVRDALFQYVKDYKEALEDFEGSVDDAGQPDVRDGDKVLEAVRAFIEEERESVEDMEDEVKDIDEARLSQP